MATNNDLIEIIAKATLQGQDVINVFHYQLLVEPDQFVDLGDIATLWGVQFDNACVSPMSVQLLYNTITMNNLTDLNEYHQGSFTASGDSNESALPVHDTVSVKLVRQSKLTRNGRKSFSGLSELNTQQGLVQLSAQQITDMEDFCGSPRVYNDHPAVGATTTLNPIILRKNNPAGVPYDPVTAIWTNVTEAVVNGRVKTQNTRKN